MTVRPDPSEWECAGCDVHPDVPYGYEVPEHGLCWQCASRELTKLRQSTVLQPWVLRLPLMQQSVLISAVRGPDGVRKRHPVKPLMRWYRRCVLVAAFEGRVLSTPYEPGGGNFTGPVENAPALIGTYLEYVDELPHHFQLHMMHAAEIIGRKHDDEDIRTYWSTFYHRVVKDLHLRPETAEAMDRRLGDVELQWREAEL